MVQFQKLTRNLFLTLHGQNVRRQQRQLSKFLMRYQEFARSCLLRGRGASFRDGVAAGKGFLCAPFWGVQICDYSARNSRCTVITLCPCKVRNKFLVNFWNCTVLLCIPCIHIYIYIPKYTVSYRRRLEFSDMGLSYYCIVLSLDYLMVVQRRKRQLIKFIRKFD